MPKGQTPSRMQRLDELMRRLKIADNHRLKYSTLQDCGLYSHCKRIFDYDYAKNDVSNK